MAGWAAGCANLPGAVMELEVIGRCLASPLGEACSSYLVRGEGGSLLLDCGPGALERLWVRDALTDLDAIVISHMHQDHMLDLVPLSNAVTSQALAERRGPDRPLTLHLPRGRGREVLRALERALGGEGDRFSSAFVLSDYDASDEIAVEGLRVTFARTAHPEPCFAARVSDGTSVLVYGADGAASAALQRHAEGADVLLVEATFVEPDPLAEEHGHMTGEQAADLARAARAGRLILTHLSPWMPGRDAENLRRAQARFPRPVELAEPGLVVTMA